jgi:hypothetical protein
MGTEQGRVLGVVVQFLRGRGSAHPRRALRRPDSRWRSRMWPLPRPTGD